MNSLFDKKGCKYIDIILVYFDKGAESFQMKSFEEFWNSS